jgi:hypothetical protein
VDVLAAGDDSVTYTLEVVSTCLGVDVLAAGDEAGVVLISLVELVVRVGMDDVVTLTGVDVDVVWYFVLEAELQSKPMLWTPMLQLLFPFPLPED